MSIPTRPAGAGDSPDFLSTDHVADRAREGDVSSRDELFRRVAPSLYAWARLHIRGGLKQRLDAEDVLQEVAYRTLSGFENWDVQKGSFRAYAFGIAKNVLKRAFDRLARDPLAGGLGAGPVSGMRAIVDTATTLTRAAARDESLRRFVDELERLPDDDRRLMLHRGLEGLAHEDVARLLQVSTDAVEKRWQRLCERLRCDARFQTLVA